LLTAVAAVVIWQRLNQQWAWGPSFDTFAFLDNALTMAGKSNYFEIFRPPVLPFITSLFFRAGFTSETAIYLIDSGFFLAGIYGLYLLCRMRLDRIWSAVACLLFISFPDVFATAVSGLSDMPAISLSIWIIYITAVAVDRDRRFYALIPVLIIVAFLTRFTTAMMIFPVFFYIFLRGGIARNLGTLTKGVIGAAVIMIANAVYAYAKAGGDMLVQLSAPYAVAAATTAAQSKALSGGATHGKAYYFSGMPGFLAANPGGYLLTVILVAGLILATMPLVMKINSADNKSHFIALIIAGGGSLVLILSNLNFILGEVLLLLLFVFIMKRYFKISDRDGVALLVVFWLLSLLLYQTHQAQKISRYFAALAPAISFLIAIGFEKGIALISRRLPKPNMAQAIKYAAAIITVGFAIFSMFSAYQKIERAGSWEVPGIKEASRWAAQQAAPGDIIYADDFVATAWYGRVPIKAMPYFKNNAAFSHELEKYDADYFVTIWHREPMGSYEVVKTFKGATIYKKKANPAPRKPALFLIGKDIDNYLEEMLGYRYYVARRKSPFPDDPNRTVGTTYIDDYKLDELSKYPVLLLYNFRWHNIDAAIALLRAYSDRGGTILIDMSGNNGSGFFDLSDADFLGTAVRTRSLPANPKVSFPASTTLAKDVNTGKFSHFLTEDGSPWFGAAYGESTVPSTAFKPLVRINKDSLIGEQKLGRGKIVWLAYNFCFHAFLYQNKDEQKLVGNLFDYALGQ
jgi:hypothetical protein